jgi:hypothetical protein
MGLLSIIIRVIELFTTCIQVGGFINDFYYGAAIADAKIKGLLSEVESFSQVLHLMKETLEDAKIQSSF